MPGTVLSIWQILTLLISKAALEEKLGKHVTKRRGDDAGSHSPDLRDPGSQLLSLIESCLGPRRLQKEVKKVACFAERKEGPLDGSLGLWGVG